jgi:hypothetical protein
LLGFLGFLAKMAYYPTPKDADTVTTWTRAGIGKERIAQRLGCSITDLERHYPFELGYTEDTALALVADVAFQMATSGQHPTMTKWWMEVRGGWLAGVNGNGAANHNPLQIVLDSDEVLEGDYETVGESNILELSPA